MRLPAVQMRVELRYAHDVTWYISVGIIETDAASQFTAASMPAGLTGVSLVRSNTGDGVASRTSMLHGVALLLHPEALSRQSDASTGHFSPLSSHDDMKPDDVV